MPKTAVAFPVSRAVAPVLALTLTLVLLAALPGCAAQGGPGAPAAPLARDEAQAAVARVLDAYSQGAMAAFAAVVAPDFAPLRPAFLDRTDRARNAEQAVQYETFIDRVLPAGGGAMAVSFTWLKKAQTSGGQTMARGRTEFVFAPGADGWLLTRMGGDNPF